MIDKRFVVLRSQCEHIVLDSDVAVNSPSLFVILWVNPYVVAHATVEHVVANDEVVYWTRLKPTASIVGNKDSTHLHTIEIVVLDYRRLACGDKDAAGRNATEVAASYMHARCPCDVLNHSVAILQQVGRHWLREGYLYLTRRNHARLAHLERAFGKKSIGVNNLYVVATVERLEAIGLMVHIAQEQAVGSCR